MIRYLNKMPTNVKQESEMKRLALEHFLGCFMILGAGMIIQLAVLANCVSTSVVVPAVVGAVLVGAAAVALVVVEGTKNGSKRG